MAIIVLCSNTECGELFEVPDKYAGRAVHCPVCGTLAATGPGKPVSAPAASAAPAAAAPAPRPPSDKNEQPLELVEPPTQAAAAPSAVPPAGTPGAAKAAPEANPAVSIYQSMKNPPPGRSAAPAAAQEEVEFVLEEEPATKRKPQTPSEDEAGQRQGRPGETAPTPNSPAESEVLAELDIPRPHQGPTTAPGAHDPNVVMRPAALAAFLVGEVGLAAGFVLGWIYCPSWPWAGAYLWAAGGWAAAFSLAFLGICAGERGGVSKVRCSSCGLVLPMEAEHCTWCGVSLAPAKINPVASGCLKVMSQARGNLGTPVQAGLLAFGGYLLVQALWMLLGQYPQLEPAKNYVLLSLAVVAGLPLAGWFSHVLLNDIPKSIGGSLRPAAAPVLFSSANVPRGLHVLAVLGAYIVPVVTLPLLPLGLMNLGLSRPLSAVNPKASLRVFRRTLTDFLVLWLVILMWSAAGALALALTVVPYHVVQWLGPQNEGVRASVDLAARGLTCGLIGAVAALLGQTLCRCIGIFARLNAHALFEAKAAPVSRGDPKGSPQGR